MDTKIYKINSESLLIAKRYIVDGELVAFPTETVYGLGGNAFLDSAIKRIFEVKGRPQDNPLIVHIDNFSKVYSVAREVPNKAKQLAEAFMPGAITLVLKKSPKISDLVTCGMDTVGVRVPSCDATQRFLSCMQVPIAAPSANSSKRPSPTTSDHVYADLHGKINMILDGGSCEIGIESTVIDITKSIPIILRPGIITKSQIESVIGEVDVCTSLQDNVSSPGMKYAHYAPKCPMYLFDNIELAKQKYNDSCMIFTFEESCKYFEGYNFSSLGLDSFQASNRFYSMLRMYEENYSMILCQCPTLDEVGQSLMNRMMKASSGNILKENFLCEN